LEHDAEVALFRHQVHAGGAVEYRGACDLDRPGVGILKAGKAPQNRGFAASRRPQQRQCVAGLDRKRHTFDRHKRAEQLAQLFDLHKRHAPAPQV
jgi:hypothetical protein